jgi:hypothetical protein
MTRLPTEREQKVLKHCETVDGLLKKLTGQLEEGMKSAEGRVFCTGRDLHAVLAGMQALCMATNTVVELITIDVMGRCLEEGGK